MTDALGTPATAPYGDAAQVGVRAARAGVDVMLYSSYAAGKAAARRLARAIRRGRVHRSRAEQSVRPDPRRQAEAPLIDTHCHLDMCGEDGAAGTG